jgi:hypothetical protein
MWEQRSRHQVLGRMRVEETLQAPTMEKLYKLHYFPVQGSCLVPNTKWLYHFCIPTRNE